MPNDRPKIGPADPETRRKLLRAKLEEPTRGEGVAAKTEPPKKRKTLTLKDALNPKVPRERRAGPKGETMEEAVDAAVKGAKPDPY